MGRLAFLLSQASMKVHAAHRLELPNNARDAFNIMSAASQACHDQELGQFRRLAILAGWGRLADRLIPPPPCMSSAPL